MTTSRILQTRLRAASLSALALAMAFGASTASAQDAAPSGIDPCTDADTTNDAGCDDIVVTGFANSLTVATNTKRNADQIIESVSAEDIGKLPDASIGESIARLPGVTSQRLNGRSNVISIRGLGPDLSQSLLNGREQTSTGDNRAVEFDQYPSEIVSQLVVYKSPTASLVGQGLAGTIDIRTIRPLEVNHPIIAFGARGSYADLGRLNADSNDFGYRVNGTFVDQFADDTIGVALAASYVDEPYQIQEFNAWGYAGAGTAASPAVIGGSKSFATSTQLSRFGVNGTLQIDATPTLRLTFDGFYSHFNDDQAKRGIELPLGFTAFGVTGPTNTTVQNGHVVAGTFSNVRGVVRNDRYERTADLYSGGFNARYQGNDGWNAFFDFGYSRTDRNELSIESYSGTGFNGDDTGNGAAATIGFRSGTNGTVFSPSLDYSNYGSIFLTDPLGWGGGVTPQSGYYNNRIINDELKQYRVEVEHEFENSFIHSVQVGWNYTDRSKSLTPDEFLVRLAGNATTTVIPTQYRLPTTTLSYLGLGPIVSYDARQLIANGVLRLESNNANSDVRSKAYTISENLLTAYIQANIDTQLFGGDLTGNIGVQAINTDQSSTGPTFNNNTFAGNRTLGANYWDVLPSINLSLRLPSNTVIRFAAAREIQRPRLDDLRVAIGIGVSQLVGPNIPANTFIYSGGGGNPLLRPYRANSIDLNFEQYFGHGGVVSLQLFYKDIVEYISNDRVLFDFAGLPLPTTNIIGNPTSTVGLLSSSFNTGSGSLKGVELAFTVPAGGLVSALDGFGVTGGVGYTDTAVNDSSGGIINIPGYSDWVANGTVYFEKWGFNTRASARYRSTFLGDFSGFGGSPTRRQALQETIIDGQIGYDFQEGSFLHGLSLYFQGQNLTDERFTSVSRTSTPLQVIDYQIYGRRFLAGFTYRF